jgi:PleD family two-component response regulator
LNARFDRRRRTQSRQATALDTEGAGYAVDLATDGEDGHYLGSTENYDAVILDLGLPEVDGLTVPIAGARRDAECPSWCSPPGTAGPTKSQVWTPALMTISQSHSRPKS